MVTSLCQISLHVLLHCCIQHGNNDSPIYADTLVYTMVYLWSEPHVNENIDH